MVVNPKSVALSGTASFTIVIEPNLVFVKVQVTSAPAARVIVAVRVSVSPRPAGANRSRPVSFQPATALSVTE